MAAKCERMGIRISSLVDRELWEFEARSVRSHIEECANCTAIYRELRSARLAARSLPQSDPPSDLWPGVSEKLEEIDRRYQAHRECGVPVARQSHSFVALIGAALAGALIIIAWLALHLHRVPQPSAGISSSVAVHSNSASVSSGSQLSTSRRVSASEPKLSKPPARVAAQSSPGHPAQSSATGSPVSGRQRHSMEPAPYPARQIQ